MTWKKPFWWWPWCGIENPLQTFDESGRMIGEVYKCNGNWTCRTGLPFPTNFSYWKTKDQALTEAEHQLAPKKEPRKPVTGLVPD